MDPYLMTLPQTAKYLSVSLSTVRRMVVQNKIPGVIRIGGVVRIDRRDVDIWLQEKKEMQSDDRSSGRRG